MVIDRRRALIGVGASLIASPALARHRRKRAVASTSHDLIEVRAKAGATSGVLRFHGAEFPCMVGRSGVVHPKYEGDGGTPAGRFPLREVRFRPDHMNAPKSGLPVFKATQSDGWCDDPEDPFYNRIVHMPYQTDAETMWRDDDLYDVLAVIGYNDAPTLPGAGSAIFLHVARVENGVFKPTAGCVSMRKDDLLAVLLACTPRTEIDIRSI
jgi:L,D-peptidoglycan transpeptidase YkuD (ErfK/YbiS/YcfS/YnhG family)